MENDNNNKTTGKVFGLLFKHLFAIVQVQLIMLKYLRVIDMPWHKVFTPLYVYIGVWVCSVTLLIVLSGIIALLGRNDNK